MSTALPERLDLARLADLHAVLDGTLPLTGFARLVPQLASRDGRVVVHLEFSRHGGRELVRGTLRAELQLVCQRCLGPVAVEVEAPLALARVADDDEAAALADGLDPIVAPNREVESAALLEDELLLAIPQVPRHERDADCDQAALRTIAASQAGANPFAALAALKKN
jgi:uncharacterized protein